MGLYDEIQAAQNEAAEKILPAKKVKKLKVG